ncbi:von Willebrand factor D and EGF domain-containing protein-like [Mytilus californianus]|uniref:von Willebrand factor D and EGF domain-containing protein-like n=1 Tax=Mytilus californianus TaxID=6549 RepID=UPI0022461FC7|nr:von Willebrand factor D and EGF domain-containing protein-like [Mytilus californianus]
MKASCLNEIRMNTTFWKPKPKLQTTTARNIQLDRKTQSTTTSTTTSNLEIDISILDIAETVLNNDCPNDCSESGICQQGICECDDGFEGADCSVDRRKGPEVFGLIEESFCDLSKRPCSFISVFGNRFYASGNVKCRILEAKIELNEVKSKTLNVPTDGSLITFAEVKCPLEQMDVNKSQTFLVLDAYMVSVSFDAIKYSTGSPIIVYDSTCTICKDVNGTVDCRMREDVCVVERKCYTKEHDMCKTSTEAELSKHTTSPEILYEPSKQTFSPEILYETSKQTTSPDILSESSKQTTSSEVLSETKKQAISPKILYLGVALGGLEIVVVPTLLLIRRM